MTNAGKGDNYRPVDYDKYRANYERIFGSIEEKDKKPEKSKVSSWLYQDNAYTIRMKFEGLEALPFAGYDIKTFHRKQKGKRAWRYGRSVPALTEIAHTRACFD